ncbi:GNAT family N-acetyltransferase [Nocardia sp. NPDC003999]
MSELDSPQPSKPLPSDNGESSVVLLPATDEDLTAIEPWFDDPDTLKHLSSFTIVETPGARRYIAWNHDRERVAFIMTTPVEMAGKVLYNQVAVGYTVAAGHRRKGYGAATVKALLDHPDTQDVKIFEAGIHAGNDGSIKVVEQSGFELSLLTYRFRR